MVDADAFRDALGRFATGVTVVTYADEDGDHGITVNSFTSLSLSPPLVLWNCDVEATTHDRLDEGDAYAVNVLSADQQWLSDRFAGAHQEMADPFHDVAVERGATGSPLIEDSLATIDCSVEAVHPGGDHSILVGRVEEIDVSDPDADPLLFYRGEYREMA